MSVNQVQNILDIALTRNGCTVEMPDEAAAHSLRRQLYNARVRHRKRGNNEYDGLYFRVMEGPPPNVTVTVGLPFDIKIIPGDAE
jgi:hypothetical protein